MDFGRKLNSRNSLRRLNQQLSALCNIFMLILINKDEDGVLGLIGYFGDYFGYTTAYLLFLLPVQFAGYPDVDVGHDVLLAE